MTGEPRTESRICMPGNTDLFQLHRRHTALKEKHWVDQRSEHLREQGGKVLEMNRRSCWVNYWSNVLRVDVDLSYHFNARFIYLCKDDWRHYSLDISRQNYHLR